MANELAIEASHDVWYCMQGDSGPAKVFDRAPNMAGTQIISYRTSADGKWAVLIGITAGAPER